MDFRRAFLVISLGLVLLLIWQAWLEYEAEKNARFSSHSVPAGGQTGAAEVPSAVPAAPPPHTADEIPQLPAAIKAIAPSAADSLGQPGDATAAGTVRVETDLLQLEIDLRGGDLRDARLLAYPVAVDTPEIPFSIFKGTGPDILVAQSGLVGSDENSPNHKTLFSAPADRYTLTNDLNSIAVPLYWTAPNGIQFTKTYTFYRDEYLVDVEYRIDNASGAAWQGFQYGQFLSAEYVPDSEGFFIFRALPSYRGAAIYTPDEKYEKIDYKEIRNDSPVIESAPSGWVAMLQHYFVAAWLPQENGPYQFYTKVLTGAGEPRYQAGYVARTPTTVESGSAGAVSSQLYVGPKDHDRIDDPAEGLILTVDYGWLTPISSPLFWILDHINGVIKNWGFSIILLTLLVKIVFYPLSAASYKSMGKMKKLQPRLKTLKERYGDDRQAMNQEMMQIYKKEKINPLGGCLPILIQIPVFIALYWVLLESVELRQAPFIFWLNDLSRSDPYYVLPVLMGVSMFAQQFLNPTPLDSMQKNIMMSLPIVFTFFFLWFPSGLVLYWLVNNILSIAQQWYITRRLAAE